MCKILNEIIEHPEILDNNNYRSREFCVHSCDGCCLVINWELGIVDLTEAQFLLRCIEKRAELEISPSVSQ